MKDQILRMRRLGMDSYEIVGIELQPLHVHIEVALWFTVISLIRSYVLRRWFNG